MPQGLSGFEPFLAFGGKVDPLAEIRNAGIITSGSVFWVKATGDSDYTTFQYQVGANIVLNDVQSAVNKARNDKNDYVMVIPQDANAVFASSASNAGTALYLNKARLHLLSVGYTKSVHGYTNTIRGLATAAAYDTQVVAVQAPGIEIGGFKIQGTAGTTANGTMTSVVNLGTAASGTAHQTWIHDVMIENLQAVSGGANGTADGVKFGGTVNGVRLDNVTVLSNAVGMKVVNLAGNGCQRPEFHNCKFVVAAQATSDIFVGAGTGASDYVLFDTCSFINLNSAAKHASAVTGSVSTLNPFLMQNCTYVNVTQAGTDPTVFKQPALSGTQAAVADVGIAIGTAAISPV